MAVVDGDILRVSLNFELGDGTLYQNIYHYIRDGTDPFSDSAHVTALRDQMGIAYADLIAQVKDDVVEKLSFVDRVEFNEIVDEWRVVENVGTFTMAFVPTGVSDTIPYQSSPYVVFKTARPKTVGKKFLFPFIETQQANTILEAGAVTQIIAYAADILSAIALGGDATLTAGVIRTGIDSFFPYLVAVVGDLLGSQRRRRPGVGA